MQLNLSGTAIECAALAKRFEISAITNIRATGNLKRVGSARVRLSVLLEAEVIQTCVVTLDPVSKRIEEKLDVQFEYGRILTASPNLVFDPGSDLESLVDDFLDVGEFLAEELALSLDPYPKKSGIAPAEELEGFMVQADELSESRTFEALAALKRKE